MTGKMWMRRALSLLLCLILFVACAAAPAQAAVKTGKWKNNVFLPEKLTLELADVKKLMVLDTAAAAPATAQDVSQGKNKSVLAWLEGDTLYIAGEGGVNAREACKDFSKLKSIPYIDFNGCFHMEEVTSLGWMFHYGGVRYVNFSGLDLSKVRDTSYMFDRSSIAIADFTGVKTGALEDMSYMFSNCPNLTLPLIADLDVSKVTNMTGVFYEANALHALDLKAWNTGNVTDMTEMFRGCRNLHFLDISTWDTSKVKSFVQMFVMFDEEHPMNTAGWELGKWETGGMEQDLYHDFLPEGTMYKGQPWQALFGAAEPVPVLELDPFLKAYKEKLKEEGFKHYSKKEAIYNNTNQVSHTVMDDSGNILLFAWRDTPDTILLKCEDKNLTDAQKKDVRRRMLLALCVQEGWTEEEAETRIQDNILFDKPDQTGSQWEEDGVTYIWSENHSNYQISLRMEGKK